MRHELLQYLESEMLNYDFIPTANMGGNKLCLDLQYA
jgi:hypothetical protein